MEADLIIAGAGPAGLFAAIQAAKENQDSKIIILEKNSKPGKKLLITGSGQCNLTHSGTIDHFFDHYGDNYNFLMGALYTFNNQKLMQFFQNRGIKFRRAKGGKIFPKSNQAADILNVLLKEIKKRNIEIIYNSPVKKVKKDKKLFKITTTKNHYQAKCFLLAVGGKSFPKTGSTGDGFKLAADLGHKIIKVKPALAPVKIENYQFKLLSGISLRNKEISLWRNNKLLRRWSGDLLLTHQGLSGPAIINYSRYIQPGDLIKIKLLKYTKEELEKNLLKKIKREGKLNLLNLLVKYPLAQRLIEKILAIAEIESSKNAAHLSKEERKEIIELFSNLKFKIKSLAGFNQSMVTNGGIDLEVINPQTMESKLLSNFYAAGEVLNIDGDTGGYNLQAAFSTAYLAGKDLAKKL